MSKWAERWFGLAEKVATFSEDPNTQVGAVTANGKDLKTIGWNGLPSGVRMDVPDYPEKAYYMEHAERNAIYNATRNGISLKGSSIYVTHFPCADCTRAIIQAGIVEVHYIKKIEAPHWKASNDASQDMLDRAGIKCVPASSELPPKILPLQDLKFRLHEVPYKTERQLATSVSPFGLTGNHAVLPPPSKVRMTATESELETVMTFHLSQSPEG